MDQFDEVTIPLAEERTFGDRAGSRELAQIMTAIEEIDRLGHRWRPECPENIDKHQVPVLFAATPNAQYATLWHEATVSVGGLACLCERPCRNRDKNFRGISLAKVNGFSRMKNQCVAVTGLVLDDDGVIGRALAEEALERDDAAVVITYQTASDGKRSDAFSVQAFKEFAAKTGCPKKPTDETAARYLNESCKYGPAYKNVRLRPDIQIGYDGLEYVADFDPQQRTRFIVVFSRPLEGETLELLKENPALYLKFCRACELKILGVNGCDGKTMQPVAIAYLPSGDPPDFYFKVMGSVLFDPYPIAEQILAENKREARKPLTVGGEISPADYGTLRGVLLASLLSEQYPELCANSATTPTVLRKCPFADGHRSKRGQSDRSAFVFDPDPDKGKAYPTVRCHHDSCSDHLTEDFVAEMIASGDLDGASVYQSADYRIAIEKVSKA